jgi:hypothetical protein
VGENRDTAGHSRAVDAAVGKGADTVGADRRIIHIGS